MTGFERKIYLDVELNKSYYKIGWFNDVWLHGYGKRVFLRGHPDHPAGLI